LRERIADGYTLRQFADFYCQPVPKHDAFNRAFNRLTPKTLQAVNELVVQAAVDVGLEDGQKLRVDSTVVQTDVHHPTDNTLLWDVVRVVTRLVGRLAEAVQQRIRGFHNRTRAARLCLAKARSTCEMNDIRGGRVTSYLERAWS
jgi:IS5 family transposase